VRLVEAGAEALPFEDASFDGLTAAYLLRYLDDLPAGVAELARVLRPGATAALLDFGVPPAPLPRGAWNLWVDVGLPVLGRAISPGWHEVGRFLGGSIRAFEERWPVPRLLAALREAGFDDVRARRLSLGGCTVLWGRRA
jgi:demethylmenaquinone methyltransferase/2-methoxy-6-polyprenyl-1,4-benzoquinol methylase